MSRPIDYYFSLHSPWAFIGHAEFVALAARHGRPIVYKPVFLIELFEETGGLPLAKRHPARQHYRMIELKRWRDRRGLDFHTVPKHWPFSPALADRAVIALAASGRDPEPFLTRAFAAAWQDERDLADEAVVAELAQAAGHDGAALVDAAKGSATAATYALNHADAVAAGVFGSPSYVVDGEVFWGQDRLDLVADMLASGRAALTAAPD
ncbi:2-hydroxychromene-2-carboxylate isomerase [Segnochrobactrum spirostomi]|uniref:2-hydroxychromene-2-carboxylate isomerase n=1 Tax=Segnochrobactrum spirostomi TaxID=2608987 RepID=A0A6A7Y4R7_9HYPH|nr:2-hydroxychromene-2-carboxylate isomerase [Segnochrobactrum spirostomi]MQT13357.1 2-hydroxychromene-2-carboxylate isomerase [Segnochrobactrum spirostomi]